MSATQVLSRSFFKWTSYISSESVLSSPAPARDVDYFIDVSAYSQAKRRWEGSTSPYGCGEDSFFIFHKDGKSSCLGVCDGVGGWNAFGVNPAFIARQMCLNMHAFAKENSKMGLPHCPQVLMSRAYEKIKSNGEVEAGSTTCCILSLDTTDPSQPLLRSANLGDSGYVVVRGGEVAFHSDFQRVELAPMQLAIIPERFSSIGAIQTDPAQADLKEHAVEGGDIIILASDGLWDNCSVADMTVLVTEMDNRGASTAEIAQVLVETALSFYVKPDDITVVVGKVKSA